MDHSIKETYHQTSNTSPTLVDNKIIDHSDVVGASPWLFKDLQFTTTFLE